uniref:Uncharacterized protein n=1 Tax=Trieres chinensis TaxID=1514140 RepID=A0A7S2A080_TRICV
MKTISTTGVPQVICLVVTPVQLREQRLIPPKDMKLPIFPHWTKNLRVSVEDGVGDIPPCGVEFPKKWGSAALRAVFGNPCPLPKCSSSSIPGTINSVYGNSLVQFEACADSAAERRQVSASSWLARDIIFPLPPGFASGYTGTNRW